MLESKINYFSRILKNSGMRMTEQRKALLSFLEETDYSISIKDLYSSLDEQGVSIDEASVYRTVESLKTLKLVHQQSDGKIKLCSHHSCGHDFHISLECSKCHKVIEPHLDSKKEEMLSKLLGLNSENIDHIQVEVQCQDCR